MARLSMECKKMMAEEIAGRLSSTEAFIVTNYKGLSAEELNELRKDLRAVSSGYFIIKDSIAKKALANTTYKGLLDLVKGEVGIVLDRKGDALASSKVVAKFSKEHGFLEICGGLINGTVVSSRDIKMLASLPPREVLIGRLANVLNAPIQGLASALNAVIAKFVYALSALRDKKEK